MFQEKEMEAKYKLSEGEYVRGNKLFTQLSKASKIKYTIAVLILVAIFIFANSPAIKGGSVFAIIGGFLGHIIQRHIYAPWATKRQYRNYKAAQKETIISLVDEGIEFKVENGEAILKWQDVYNWRENDELLLVYQAPHVYHIIPKSICRQSSVLDGLMSSLVSNVKRKT